MWTAASIPRRWATPTLHSSRRVRHYHAETLGLPILIAVRISSRNLDQKGNVIVFNPINTRCSFRTPSRAHPCADAPPED